MVEWTYAELKNAIREDLQGFEMEREYNYSPGQVAGRCFYEYTTVCSSGYTETMIVHAEIGTYIIEKCSPKSIKGYSDTLKNIFSQFRCEQLDKELTEDEKDELEGKVNVILQKINKFKMNLGECWN